MAFLMRVLDCLAWQPMRSVELFAPTVVAMLSALGMTAPDVLERAASLEQEAAKTGSAASDDSSDDGEGSVRCCGASTHRFAVLCGPCFLCDAHAKAPWCACLRFAVGRSVVETCCGVLLVLCPVAPCVLASVSQGGGLPLVCILRLVVSSDPNTDLQALCHAPNRYYRKSLPYINAMVASRAAQVPHVSCVVCYGNGLMRWMHAQVGMKGVGLLRGCAGGVPRGSVAISVKPSRWELVMKTDRGGLLVFGAFILHSPLKRAPVAIADGVIELRLLSNLVRICFGTRCPCVELPL